MIKDLTNEELVVALKEVVWKGGWDAVINEIERRMKKLTRLEGHELLSTEGQSDHTLHVS